jgi:hypothetical protein
MASAQRRACTRPRTRPRRRPLFRPHRPTCALPIILPSILILVVTKGRRKTHFLLSQSQRRLCSSLHHSCDIIVSRHCLAPVTNKPSRRFLRSCAPELFSKPCSEPVPGRQEPKPPSSFPGHRAPPVDSLHRPSSGLADPGNSFAWAPRYSPTHSPAALTSPSAQCHHSPLVEQCRRGTPSSNEFLTSHCLKSGFPLA